MKSEAELIKMISGGMPRSEKQLNKVFESDSEILELNGSKLLFNIDEFSGEDMQRENDPFTLGWNAAVGALSDILATGGRPVYYAHSLTASISWTDEFIQYFSGGVAACLRRAETSFTGGDFGKSSVWRYCASVIGVLEGNPLLRSSAKAGDSIYITGKIGVGNFEAGLKIYSGRKLTDLFASRIKNRFSLRIREAGLIKKHSRCCIDTSDGVFNSLCSISEMSSTGFEVLNLPYIKAGLAMSKLLSVPKSLLFLGECGEYELLFTLGREAEAVFLQEANNEGMKFYKIGKVTEPGKRTLFEDGRKLDLIDFNIRARDFEDTSEYLKKIIEFIRGD